MRFSRKDWGRLVATLDKIIDPALGLELHFEDYCGPRYRVAIQGRTIWDFPRDYLRVNNPSHPHAIAQFGWWWQYDRELQQHRVMRAYLDTPRVALMEFPGAHRLDKYHLGGILLAADRRIGYRRMAYWALLLDEPGHAARKILKARFGES